MRDASAPVYVQAAFDELDEPLREVTFVVLDLETTGGGTDTEAITEIGAVKVRGGEVLGEFATLVDPGRGIPALITVLTGITDLMVASAPPIESVLPAFLEFCRDAVLVAHNAPFDLGFLKAACARLERPWPPLRVVDTALLARRVLTSDEVPDCRLATLATHFKATTTPVHRALADARATVDVLHGLLERVGPLGVQSLDELRTFTAQVSEAQRRKRHLAEDLPSAPGVYIFRDAAGRPLYVGKSKDIRSRVRHYFVASELRSRMAEMVGLAERVDAIVCAHDLEAEVRELRMIAEHKPPYNRRSRFPERGIWLKLTREAYPRLSVVRSVRDDGGSYLGPFGSRKSVERAMAAVHDALPLRQCTDKIPDPPTGSACALAEMDRCGAPCEGRISREEYGRIAALVRDAVAGDPRPLTDPLLRKVTRLSEAGRYEQAATVRDRAGTFGSRKSVERAMAAVHDALPLRQCTDKIPDPPKGSACALAEMDRCGAPCEGRISREEYGAIAALVRDAVAGDPRPLTDPLLRKVNRLSEAGRYEQAATVRDRAGTFARACARVQRLAGLTSVEHMVAARPDGNGGWELAVARHGRLVAAGVAVRGAAVRPYVAALVATAESVLPGVGPLPCATAEETERILRWLEEPGTRLVELTGTWACPAHGAGGLGELLEWRDESADPTADRRRIRPIPRPAR